ncbi:hypothetical protein ACTXT7_002861 [Hymenolepis weldensis]
MINDSRLAFYCPSSLTQPREAGCFRGADPLLAALASSHVSGLLPTPALAVSHKSNCSPTTQNPTSVAATPSYFHPYPSNETGWQRWSIHRAEALSLMLSSSDPPKSRRKATQQKNIKRKKDGAKITWLLAAKVKGQKRGKVNASSIIAILTTKTQEITNSIHTIQQPRITKNNTASGYRRRQIRYGGCGIGVLSVALRGKLLLRHGDMSTIDFLHWFSSLSDSSS